MPDLFCSRSSKSEIQLCTVAEMSAPKLEVVTHSDAPRPKTASYTLQAAERDLKDLSSSMFRPTLKL